MNTSSFLLELFGRIPPLAKKTVEGLPEHRLIEPPGEGRNPIAWLIWHLARTQDDHISELLGEGQVWLAGDWAKRFSLSPDPENTGYGHSKDEVATVRPDRADTVVGYLYAVSDRSRTFLESVTDEDLDKIVDRSYDPPVTMGVRLASIASDSLQHVGQAAYVRGLLEAG